MKLCADVRCLIDFDGAFLSHESKDASWDRFYMGAPPETIRRAIQHSQESLRTLAKRYGINPKTVAERGPQRQNWN